MLVALFLSFRLLRANSPGHAYIKGYTFLSIPSFLPSSQQAQCLIRTGAAEKTCQKTASCRRVASLLQIAYCSFWPYFIINFFLLPTFILLSILFLLPSRFLSLLSILLCLGIFGRRLLTMKTGTLTPLLKFYGSSSEGTNSSFIISREEGKEEEKRRTNYTPSPLPEAVFKGTGSKEE